LKSLLEKHLDTDGKILIFLNSDRQYHYLAEIAKQLRMSPMTAVRHLKELINRRLVDMLTVSNRVKLYRVSTKGNTYTDDLIREIHPNALSSLSRVNMTTVFAKKDPSFLKNYEMEFPDKMEVFRLLAKHYRKLDHPYLAGRSEWEMDFQIPMLSVEASSAGRRMFANILGKMIIDFCKKNNIDRNDYRNKIATSREEYPHVASTLADLLNWELLSVFSWEDPLNRPAVHPGDICGDYQKGDQAFVVNLMISGGLTTADVCDHLRRNEIDVEGVFSVIELLQQGKKPGRELLKELDLSFKSFTTINALEIQRTFNRIRTGMRNTLKTQ